MRPVLVKYFPNAQLCLCPVQIKLIFYDDDFVFISLHKIKTMLCSNSENICFTLYGVYIEFKLMK